MGPWSGFRSTCRSTWTHHSASEHLAGNRKARDRQWTHHFDRQWTHHFATRATNHPTAAKRPFWVGRAFERVCPPCPPERVCPPCPPRVSLVSSPRSAGPSPEQDGEVRGVDRSAAIEVGRARSRPRTGPRRSKGCVQSVSSSGHRKGVSRVSRGSVLPAAGGRIARDRPPRHGPAAAGRARKRTGADRHQIVASGDHRPTATPSPFPAEGARLGGRGRAQGLDRSGGDALSAAGRLPGRSRSERGEDRRTVQR